MVLFVRGEKDAKEKTDLDARYEDQVVQENGTLGMQGWTRLADAIPSFRSQ